MPAIANIVVADATPTNHTFKPQSASMALSTWAETSATTFEGNGRIAIAMSPPSSTRKTSRIKLTLHLPVERTVDGVVKVTDTCLYTLEGVIPATCSASEAEQSFTILQNLVASTLAEAYFASREPAW